MPCYKPLNAARFKTNKSKIWFIKSGSPIPTNAEYLRLPCGQCTGCRLDRSRHWATRCMHEARQHDQKSFITLTYRDEELPMGGTLILSHWQNFMKRLRKHVKKYHGQTLKFYHAGEYGEQFKRPHYHAIIFGWAPVDAELLQMSGDNPIYRSATLESIWGHGFASFGDVTWASAAYVARYCLKKINGPKAEQIDPVTGLRPYDRIDPRTGDICEVLPEYSTQSNGIGKSFVQKYLSDVYPHDEVIVNGHPTRPPRYYDSLYERDNPDSMEEIKERRLSVMEDYLYDNTRSRLQDKETVKLAAIKTLTRKLE